jgi:ribosomal protein L32
MAKLYQDRGWLSEHYEQKMFSINEIAEICSVGNRCIGKWLKKFNIQTRTPSEGCKLKWQNSEFRQRTTAAIQKSCKKPSVIKNMQIASQQLHSNKLFREKCNYIMQSEEYRKKQSMSQKKRMLRENDHNKAVETLSRCRTDEEIKKRHTAAVKKALNKPEVKNANIVRTKALWADRQYRIKTSNAIKLAFKDPVVAFQQSERSKKIWENEEYRQKISESSKKLWSNSSYQSKQAIAKLKQPKTSILETIIISILKDVYNINATQIALGPWTFDIGFEYNGRRILIECQGSYWHSRPERQLRDKQKHTYWERHLSKEYELHYIYEYEFYGINCIRDRISKILSIEPKQEIFDFNNVEIRLIQSEESNTFLNQYHYLSKSRGGLKIGAFVGDLLIACTSFNSVTRKQSADRLKLPTTSILELDRFCIHPSYHKKNFASWFLAHSVNLIPNNIKCLISFADVGANHSGVIYKAAGWILDGRTKPSYWYIDANGHRYHKKTVWDQAKRIRMSEKEYAESAGLIKINGMPVIRFIKQIN